MIPILLELIFSFICYFLAYQIIVKGERKRAKKQRLSLEQDVESVSNALLEYEGVLPFEEEMEALNQGTLYAKVSLKDRSFVIEADEPIKMKWTPDGMTNVNTIEFRSLSEDETMYHPKLICEIIGGPTLSLNTYKDLEHHDNAILREECLTFGMETRASGYIHTSLEADISYEKSEEGKFQERKDYDTCPIS